MPVEVFFRRLVPTGTEYVTAPREALIIEEVGFKDEGEYKFLVDRKETTPLLGPLPYYDDSKTYGSKPLALGALPIVVPPETAWSITGSPSTTVLLLGRKVQLGIGEAIPDEIARRFAEQYNRYLKIYKGNIALAVNQAWAADAELTALQFTTLANERVTFNGPVLVRWSGFTLNPGSVVLRFYMDGRPIENVYRTGWEPGIDLKTLTTVSEYKSYGARPFSLERLPIVVNPNTVFTVTMENISGADIAPASGQAISIELWLLAVYEKGVG
ncbi:MAG: hypothetical protein QXJ59_07705 [Thermofilaceae archaeon]